MLSAAIPVPSRVTPERPSDRPAVDALVLAAFGPGRFAKTAERLREGGTPVTGFVAREGDRLIGSVRLWAVAVGQTPALFLGPIAVDADHRKGGLGGDLVTVCVDAARGRGVGGVLLVGDAYFARFGFVAAPDLRLPGPVDPRRIFWLPLDGASPPSGLVRSIA